MHLGISNYLLLGSSLLDLWENQRGVSNAFFNTIFVSSHMYPENPEGTQVIVGSMNLGYISDTARNRTHNLFLPSGSRYH